MPIIPRVGTRSFSTRVLVICMYLILTVLGVTMVMPFMITVSSSFSNDLDYERFRPVPRYFTSSEDRYFKGLVRYFNRYPKWYDQMRARYKEMPQNWASWRDIGRDLKNVDRVGSLYLSVSGEELERWKIIAADYSRFTDEYPLEDTLMALSDVEAAHYLHAKYLELFRRLKPELSPELQALPEEQGALGLMNKAWGLPLENFYTVSFEQGEMRLPYWQPSWFPPSGGKYDDFTMLKKAYHYHVFSPGIEGKWKAWLKSKGVEAKESTGLVALTQTDDAELLALWREFKAEVAPASPAVPFAMRVIWREYLDGDEARKMTGIPPEKRFDIDTYNRIAGTQYDSFFSTPFPVSQDTTPEMKALWKSFVETRWPIRLTSINVSDEMQARFLELLKERFKTLKYANQVLRTDNTEWEQFELTPTAPTGASGGSLQSLWIDFVKKLPIEDRVLSSSEHAFQRFLLNKYESVDKVNEAYGWNLQRIEEAFPPFDIAYTVTFKNSEWAFTLLPVFSNYQYIMTFLLKHGKAITVTLILIALTIFMTLTINPMAAYALSRFNLPGKDKVLLFMLATMAFPAMVSAIPAYLLMRDLGLLNTFFALVLPGAANGMSIFILKGFFDSLPQELYEAATIDGAKEWQIFSIITMPMMKPILAINSLNAFIGAYNGWQWAMIICQNKNMWTLSVWMYQANQWWSMNYPWLVMAGFVVISIPTLIVFLFCQKIILRGIIIPSMK